jgi:hypothetical protein
MASVQKRVSTHWNYDPKNDVEVFNLDEINSTNLINHLLKLTKDDVSYTMMMKLFGLFKGKSLCKQYDTFTVPVGAWKYNSKPDGSGREVSNKSTFVTTIGIWIFNVFIIRDFGFCSLFNGYINKNLTAGKFEDLNQVLVYALLEDKIDTKVYTEFLNYTQFLMPYETILMPNHSERVLTCTKILSKKKAELFKQYSEELKAGNPAVTEKVEKELLKYAEEYLKDDPGLDGYLSGAGGKWGNNFKNMYVMNGALRNPDPNAKQEYNISSSCFMDGISKEEYSIIANSLVGGPYSRSKKTEIGGYWEKLIRDGFQTVILDEPGTDCGSKKYIEVLLTPKNLKLHIYNWIIQPDGSLVELTMDNKDKFMNKKVKMRFNIFCKNKSCKICSKCAGNFMYRRGGRNIGLATIQLAAKLKLVSMKSFHDSVIHTVEIDPEKAFSYFG